MNNSPQLQQKRRRREDDVTVGRKVTRSCTTPNKSFEKLSDSYEEEEMVEGDETETESDKENEWP